MVSININISNKVVYTLIVIILCLMLGTVVYSYGTNNPAVFGHNPSEIGPGTFAGGGDYIFPSNIQAPVFYDKDNKGYYVNPAGTSKLNRVDANIIYDKQNTGYYVDPAGTSKFKTINLGGVSRSSWSSGGEWPAGSYCILANGACPSGFQKRIFHIYYMELVFCCK